MTYAVKDLQERFGVGEHTVLGWINSGELRAINVARTTSKRPKYRISEPALKAFEELRSTAPPAPTRVNRRRKPNDDIIEFIK